MAPLFSFFFYYSVFLFWHERSSKNEEKLKCNIFFKSIFLFALFSLFCFIFWTVGFNIFYKKMFCKCFFKGAQPSLKEELM